MWLWFLVVAVTLFNLLYIVILTSRPVEIVDCNGDIDYWRVFIFAFAATLGMAFVTLLVKACIQFMPSDNPRIRQRNTHHAP